MRMASGRIRNLDDTLEYGTISWAVPAAVMTELERLSSNPAKAGMAAAARRMAGTMSVVDINGEYADDAILEHIRDAGGWVATLDRNLKRRIKAVGGHIMSLHDDCLVLDG